MGALMYPRYWGMILFGHQPPVWFCGLGFAVFTTCMGSLYLPIGWTMDFWSPAVKMMTCSVFTVSSGGTIIDIGICVFGLLSLVVSQAKVQQWIGIIILAVCDAVSCWKYWKTCWCMSYQAATSDYWRRRLSPYYEQQPVLHPKQLLLMDHQGANYEAAPLALHGDPSLSGRSWHSCGRALCFPMY